MSREIKFRPLRLVKKTGQIVCASYSQWNSIRSANYSGKFDLIIDNEYEKMNKSDFVYNHEGQQLYHFGYNPWELYEHTGSCIDPGFSWEEIRDAHKDFVLVRGDHKSYHIRGADTSGTPTFTHLDEDAVTSDGYWKYYGGEAFEPVTVGYVINWLGWFLYQLENAKLKVGN